MATAIDSEILSITPFRKLPLLVHGYIAPFLLLYAAAAYVWLIAYGIDDYWEAGLIAFAVIAALQILTSLSCFWSVHIRSALTCRKSRSTADCDYVKVIPTANNGHAGLVRLHHAQDLVTGNKVAWFYYQKMKYICDLSEKHVFQPLQFPINMTVGQYLDSKGHDEDSAKLALNNYGNNTLRMDPPKFAELFAERATAPFFVFQVFCVGLWCLDEYWYYSLFTLAMLVVFEATLVQQQLRNLVMIREMGNKPYTVQVYRNKRWRPISTSELLPGDLMSIGRSYDDRLVPCDLLLLRGSCIVDESMLTGESVPVMKESIEDVELQSSVDIEVDGKLRALYGGTKIVQHSPPSKVTTMLKAPDNGCVAYVLRTSFNTSQGRLLRTILYSVKRVTANNLEAFLFILFLLVFAIAASAYVWVKGSEDPARNKYKLFLECTLILTSVVPPELPIELSLAVNSSLLALTKLYVYCTEPFRIPFAGKVDICCFDKTGTLTSDTFIVEGIAGLSDQDALCPTADAPLETVQVLATCHSLVQLDDDLIGDPLEKAALDAIQWTVTKGDAVVPLKPKTYGLKIYHRHHFSSALKRMSVVAGHTAAGSADTVYLATVKGAPETLKSMFLSVPVYYDDVYTDLARRGARVLALGYKQLGVLSHQQVRDLKREEVEQGLTFAGFVSFSCPLKRDSKQVIKDILHSSHYVTMITGDNPLTACHIARELGMCSKKHTLVLTPELSTKSGSDWVWKSVDGSVTFPVEPPNGKGLLSQSYDLCLTGEGLQYLSTIHSKFFKDILPCVSVFARVAPKQKEQVITSLKELGYVTLMCGDGTNDVGALKHADIGVALLTSTPMLIKKKKAESAEQELMPAAKANNDGNDLVIRPVRPPLSLSKVAKPRPSARVDNAPIKKKMSQLLQEMEEEDVAQVVHLGDASIASPFTSKLSTTACVCHIIKQGRCTLVTTLQMFKILAINALILAYTQSVLYLDGIRFSDTQATFQGLLLAGCFLFISRSKPLQTLSKERPLSNIFNVYTIVTVVLQFAVHFACMIYLADAAHRHSPPRTEKFVDLDKKFEPNILNSTMYILSVALQLSTFAVNYKGLPFMEGLTKNKPLLYSLVTSGLAITLLSTGLLPELAAQFELVPFPSEHRNGVVLVLLLDFGCALLIDRLCQFLFERVKPKKL